MTMQKFLCTATTFLAVVMVVGCSNDEREGQPPITYVADDDPVMLAAIEKARSTVDQFITALDTPKESQSLFSIKLLVEDGDLGEHIWINSVRFENGKLYGTINNQPDKITTVKIGDEVDVAKDQISDWMYVEDNKLIGGYTLRALRDSVSEEERADFDRSVPFTID